MSAEARGWISAAQKKRWRSSGRSDRTQVNLLFPFALAADRIGCAQPIRILATARVLLLLGPLSGYEE
jgi:hypothetical protein